MISLLILLNIYFVSFTDKPEKVTPALSPRAIEQRAKWHIQTDELDYPVSPYYLDSLRRAGATIHHTSRWFNGATCEMDASLANEVAKWDFVQSVETTRDNSAPREFLKKRLPAQEQANTAVSELRTDNQLRLYNLLPLHDAGYKGQGILMTVCDGGFYRADTISCFRHELELDHFDFTDDADDFYGQSGAHGMECLSAISGILADDYYGAATQAQYYLMRSEEAKTESPKEMDNLVAALEKSDSLGVNIFSVSLGYTLFDNSAWDLPKSALDGRRTRVSRAATIAARKGMLVCAAAGNEGNKNWKSISVPADADSILTVGAVNIEGHIGSFSSYGPSADGRVKPDVCAVGVSALLISPSGFSMYSNGTSFATPLLAGMAACLWSALPNENAMQIRNRIIASADRVTEPDPYRYGYGIPDAWRAYTMYPERIETIEGQEPKTVKILRDGQVVIIRNGQTFTITGQRIK